MFRAPGAWELIIILLIVLVIFGPKKLPEIGSGIGRAIKNFRKASNEPDEIDVTPEKEKISSKSQEEKVETKETKSEKQNV